MGILYLEHLKGLLTVCIKGIYIYFLNSPPLGKGQQTFSLKSQTVNVFGCVSPTVCWEYSTAQLCHHSMKKKKRKKKKYQPEATHKQWEWA